MPLLILGVVGLSAMGIPVGLHFGWLPSSFSWLHFW